MGTHTARNRSMGGRLFVAGLAATVGVAASFLAATVATVTAPGAMAITAGGNGRLAFISSRGDSRDIWTMATDGSGLLQITSTIDQDLYPRWSPDGQRVAFSRETAGNFDVWVANADGSGAVNLTNNAAWDDYPSWSPDGQKLLFSSTRGNGDFNIWVMDADGSDPVQLTFDTAMQDYPAWSPDGAQIAFMSDALDDAGDIWVMDTDGTNATPLFLETGVDSYPAWSPDSGRIAFASHRDGNEEIYVMDADGSDPVRLTTNQAADYGPAWSPDGTLIAFSSERDGNPEIYLTTATGTSPSRITNNPADDLLPDWNIATDGSGSVSAEVTIPSSAACLELSTTAVDFGTLPLGSINEQASPEITVTNCSGISETVLARGTGATGPAAQWTLTDAAAACDTTLGTDAYRLGLDTGPAAGFIQLSTNNKTLYRVAPGGAPSNVPVIDTACPGSSGGGMTMTMSIIFVATE